MSDNKRVNTYRRSYTALGLALGLVLGGLVGILIDNMIVFAGGGMVVGLAVGAALENRRKVD